MNPKIEALESTTFGSKRFTRKQLFMIQETVAEFPNLSHRELGLTICELIQWVNPAGNHKIQSCLSALKEMEKIGLFTLPAKRAIKKSIPKEIKWTDKTKEQQNLCCQVGDLQAIRIQKVTGKEEIALWNEFVDRYHYLGYKRPIGTHSRYFIVSGEYEKRFLGCLLFSATPVYSLPSRDHWIGWQDEERKKCLNLILNNTRFLLFPWIQVKNLSSKVLSIASKQIADNWEKEHGYRPVLLETFVDPAKFKGTGYKAANWEYIGQTSGLNRNKESEDRKTSQKDIYVYPLTPDFRSALKSKRSLKKTSTQTRELSEKRKELKAEDPFNRLWQKIMEIVFVQAQAYDERWQKRKRLIDTMLIILFVFRLVFSKNHQGYQITIIELWDQCRRMNFLLPQSKPATASAFCNARKKLDETIFKDINTQVINRYENIESEVTYKWKDHRVFAVDGSKINIPKELKEAGYKTPSDNANYPQGLVSCLYQLKSQIPYDFDLVSHGNERTLAINHLKILKQNDVVVYDRGYFSYAMLHIHNAQKIQVVFRLPKQSYKVIDDFMKGEDTDSLVTIIPSKSSGKNIELKHPDMKIMPLKLRLVKYTYSGTTYTLGTTLYDPAEYSIAELSDLYHARWGIEELYKISKALINVEDFHSKYERGIKQELFAHFILITMNRIFVIKAESNFEKIEKESNSTENQKKSGKFKANLKNALVTMARNLEGLFIQHAVQTAKVIVKIITSISSCKQKVRPNRKYERKSMKPVNKWRASKKKLIA